MPYSYGIAAPPRSTQNLRMLEHLKMLLADPLFTALLGALAGAFAVGLICWKLPA